jgi:SAM-dependent methyltransferase
LKLIKQKNNEIKDIDSSIDNIGGIQTLVQCDNIDNFPMDNVHYYLQDIITDDTLNLNKIKSLASINGKDGHIEVLNVISDDEDLMFPVQSFDLVISSLGLHWVNPLPLTLFKIKNILKSDGVFIGILDHICDDHSG